MKVHKLNYVTSKAVAKNIVLVNVPVGVQTSLSTYDRLHPGKYLKKSALRHL